MQDQSSLDDLEESLDISDDGSITRSLNIRMNQALTFNQPWVDFEVKENYDLVDSLQWRQLDVDRQNTNAQPVVTVNLTEARLNAVVGLFIQTNPKINYAPRLVNKRQEGYSDIANHGVPYIEQSTDAQNEYNQMIRDTLICGVGVTDTVFSYDKPPYNGTFRVERVFPGFIFWDPGARSKNLLDAEWVIRIKITDRGSIKREYGVDLPTGFYEVELDARVMQFYSTVASVKNLGILYEYQWRERVAFWRVENPFRDLDEKAVMELAIAKGMTDPTEIELFKQILSEQIQYYAKTFEFDPEMDQMFSIDEGAEYSKFASALEYYGLETKKIKQHKFKYYRAIITGNKVVKKSENFSQSGFSLKFTTGKFSETTQMFHGMVRAIKPIQRLLNQAVSDWKGWLETIPKGGVHIESDAVEDINGFINTYAKSKFVTVYKPGALANGKMQPKQAQPTPQGLIEMIQWADEMIIQTMGLSREFLGQMVSKEQNAAFMRMQLQQGTMPLATYFDARNKYFKEQGRLYIDCLRILAENSEGTIIRNVLGDSDIEEIPLLMENIAPEYDIIIEEMPASPDEKQHTFEQMLELVKIDPKFLPLAMEYAPMEMKAKKEVQALLQPPPPPQPDPLQQALLESQAAYQAAGAKKLEAEALKIMVDAKRDMVLLETDRERTMAEIGLTKAREGSEIVKQINVSEATINERIKRLFPHHPINQ